jgi:hypothetical protein
MAGFLFGFPYLEKGYRSYPSREENTIDPDLRWFLNRVHF